MDEIPQQTLARTYLDMVMASGEKAAMLTQSLLAFSRKQTLNPITLNLSAAVEKFVKMYSRLLGENIEISLSLPQDPLTVRADSLQLDQVLMNLSTNARDAMPDGGRLIITLERIEVDEEFARIHAFERPGEYALLSVSDTGKGMDQETAQQIFEPFFTTKESGRGTGLGLAVVYGIIKQHDGYINVYSEPGEGTTFRIYLPLTGMTVSQTQAVTQKAVEGGNETILIAEDDDAIRDLLQKALSSVGYRIIEATDGEDALEKFRDHRDEIDMVFLDLVMPRMSGAEAYSWMRKERQSLKALIISGYPMNVTDKMKETASLPLIQKPFSPRDVLARVREILDEG